MGVGMGANERRASVPCPLHRLPALLQCPRAAGCVTRAGRLAWVRCPAGSPSQWLVVAGPPVAVVLALGSCLHHWLVLLQQSLQACRSHRHQLQLQLPLPRQLQLQLLPLLELSRAASASEPPLARAATCTVNATQQCWCAAHQDAHEARQAPWHVALTPRDRPCLHTRQPSHAAEAASNTHTHTHKQGCVSVHATALTGRARSRTWVSGKKRSSGTCRSRFSVVRPWSTAGAAMPAMWDSLVSDEQAAG